VNLLADSFRTRPPLDGDVRPLLFTALRRPGGSSSSQAPLTHAYLTLSTTESSERSPSTTSWCAGASAR
jgi:hypothetical protein